MNNKHPIRLMYVSVCLSLIAVGLFSCRREVPLPPIDQQQISFSRVVDLSHIITQDMPTHPGTLPPELNRPSPDGTRDLLALSTRNGSRITAAGDGRAGNVEHLSAQQLLAPAVVLDLRDRVGDDASFRIDADAITQWEGTHGPIPPDGVVLLVTGWDIRWSSPGAYMNLDGEHRIHAPSLDETALALLQERSVRGVGIDSPQLVADGLALSSQANWIVLEDLTNLEQLPPRGVTLLVGALKLQGTAASPARVFAFVP